MADRASPLIQWATVLGYVHPDTLSTQANNIRAAYHLLANRVNQALLQHRGDVAYLNSRRQEVKMFCDVAGEHGQGLDESEKTILETSVTDMQKYLQNASLESQDPPDVSSSQNCMITVVRNGRRGRPRYDIPKTFLEFALETTGPSVIARALGCNRRTVKRRALEAGLQEPSPPMFSTIEVDGEELTLLTTATPPVSIMTDEELDRELVTTKHLFPWFGKAMLRAAFLRLGHRVPVARIRACYRRAWGAPTAFGHRPIVRKEYWVPGVNSLWHHDGNHDLIHWGIVTHAFIDGKSRLLTGIRAHSNNRADTVLQLFYEAVSQYGWPSRLRGDHGGENVRCAEVMEDVKGPNRGSYIWGPSPHNSRIERIWLDYAHGIVAKWKRFFMELEADTEHPLQPHNYANRWLLHHLFLPLLNKDIRRWQECWNLHRISLPRQRQQAPQELYIFGMSQDGTRGVDVLLALEEECERRFGMPDIPTFGIDWRARATRQWEDANPSPSTPLLQSGRPDQLSVVECDEPFCPYSTEQVAWFDLHLPLLVHTSPDNLNERRLLWQAGYELAFSIPV